MNNFLKKIDSSTYAIYDNSQKLGTVSLYHNHFHNKYLYLRFNLKNYPSYSPFPEIMKRENQSLQMMTDSSEKELVNFLIKSRFILKRRCFSAEITEDYLRHSLQDVSLNISSFTFSDSIYKKCCEFLYHYYKKVHKDVSPLTATEEEFIRDVPTKTGFYQLNENNEIENLVFTENNEIAYICSSNKKTCNSFIQTVLKEMFSRYHKIFFEADDTDWAATMLLDQFKVDKSESFNTYILERD